jgi:hypothetical protein
MANCTYIIDANNQTPCNKRATNIHNDSGAYREPVYCEEHFMEQWWSGAIVGVSPDVDLRARHDADWEFSMIAFVDDKNFEMKSGFHIAEKIGRSVFSGLGIDVSKRPLEHAAPKDTQGHSWIRLGSGNYYWSFGAYKGSVTCPDQYEDPNENRHILDTQIAAIDYKISLTQKNSICDVITKWVKSHYNVVEPDKGYEFLGANCTLFVREACESAGIWYPGVSRPMWENGKGVFLSQTPASLFHSLNGNKYTYNPKNKYSVNEFAPPGYQGINLW